jgi:predicted ATP-dependent protease
MGSKMEWFGEKGNAGYEVVKTSGKAIGACLGLVVVGICVGVVGTAFAGGSA